MYEIITTVPHPTMPWVCQVTRDTSGKAFLKFYNTKDGIATGPWMALPVATAGGAWSLGDRAEFQRDLDAWLSAISSALSDAGIDHLG